MSINQQAIQALKDNESNLALDLFQKAADIHGNVRSLNNWAYVLYIEQWEPEKALEVLKRAIELNPNVHFPYSLMGEIYTDLGNWKKAKAVLLKGVAFKPAKAAFYNLGVACYQLGEIEFAAECFFKASKDSDHALSNHVKCLIELGRTDRAIEILDLFSAAADDFVGEVELGDRYLQAFDYKSAAKWYEIGWENYDKDPEWVACYVYALLKLQKHAKARKVIDHAIRLNNMDCQEIREQELTDEWPLADQQEILIELQQRGREYDEVWIRLMNGYIPKVHDDLSFQTECYLIGCKMHGNEDWVEDEMDKQQ